MATRVSSATTRHQLKTPVAWIFALRFLDHDIVCSVFNASSPQSPWDCQTVSQFSLGGKGSEVYLFARCLEQVLARVKSESSLHTQKMKELVTNIKETLLLLLSYWAILYQHNKGLSHHQKEAPMDAIYEHNAEMMKLKHILRDWVAICGFIKPIFAACIYDFDKLSAQSISTCTLKRVHWNCHFLWRVVSTQAFVCLFTFLVVLHKFFRFARGYGIKEGCVKDPLHMASLLLSPTIIFITMIISALIISDTKN